MTRSRPCATKRIPAWSKLTMLKNGEADAFVSAGSTGALHVGTSLIVRTVKGVKRPALATCMPGKKQPFLLLDCGANAECVPRC